MREYCANAKQTADATMHVMEAALLLGHAQTVVVNADRGEVLSEAAANPLCVRVEGQWRRGAAAVPASRPRREALAAPAPIPCPPLPARTLVAASPRR